MTAKYIGPPTENFKENESYTMMFQPMTGKRFRDSKDLEGEKDTRIMFYKMTGPGYLVYNSVDDLKKDFQVTEQHLSPIELKYFM